MEMVADMDVQRHVGAVEELSVGTRFKDPLLDSMVHVIR